MKLISGISFSCHFIMSGIHVLFFGLHLIIITVRYGTGRYICCHYKYPYSSYDRIVCSRGENTKRKSRYLNIRVADPPATLSAQIDIKYITPCLPHKNITFFFHTSSPVFKPITRKSDARV